MSAQQDDHSFIISIHTPVWGATAKKFWRDVELTISIHTPVWGATAKTTKHSLWESCMLVQLYSKSSCTDPVHSGLISIATNNIWKWGASRQEKPCALPVRT